MTLATGTPFKRTLRYLIASVFFDGFPKKTNHLRIANTPKCSEKNITISPKLATLASGQNFVDTQTDRHTHRQTQSKGNQDTWQI